MTHRTWMLALTATLTATVAAPGFATAEDEPVGDPDNDVDGNDAGARCRAVRGELVEDRVTTGCHQGEPSCFLGELRAPGLRASTHFRADSTAPGPSTSPGWLSYSGLFQYVNRRGTIFTRETGVVNVTTGTAASGAITALQVILGGTGRYADATGYFFVSGKNVADHIVTEVHGQLCRP